jgi:hypothetical protein
MSSMKTATVSPDGGVRTGGPGARNDTNLKAMFKSPLFSEYTETAVKNAGIAALNGNGGPGDAIPDIGVSNGVINETTAYYGYPVPGNLNFVDAPSYDDVNADIADMSKFTEGGRPASAWVPNLASPGPGSVYPSDQPTYTGNLPAKNDNYGVGMGTDLTPQASSAEISGQKIGDYLNGKSSLASIGSYTG